MSNANWRRSTVTSLLMPSLSLPLLPDQHGAGRRSIGSRDLDRKADEPVRARLDPSQVEPFHGNDAGPEQYVVRRLVADREIVDTHEANPEVHDPARSALHEADEVA